MPIPKYVQKNKHVEYRKKHRKIVKAIKGTVKSPYAVATKQLEKQYKKKRKEY